MKIDSTDLKIIQILEENGRTPNNEIAARISISEGTVRNRRRSSMGRSIYAEDWMDSR